MFFSLKKTVCRKEVGKPVRIWSSICCWPRAKATTVAHPSTFWWLQDGVRAVWPTSTARWPYAVEDFKIATSRVCPTRVVGLWTCPFVRICLSFLACSGKTPGGRIRHQYQYVSVCLSIFQLFRPLHRHLPPWCLVGLVELHCQGLFIGSPSFAR